MVKTSVNPKAGFTENGEGAYLKCKTYNEI